MDQREVLAAARRAGVKLVRFGYCDVSGVARAKAVHVSQLAHKLTEGVGLTRAQMSISLLEQVVHIDGMEPVGGSGWSLIRPRSACCPGRRAAPACCATSWATTGATGAPARGPT
jgi:Glutamine synthetase